jgi:predicted DNA-binding WGR domain protein
VDITLMASEPTDLHFRRIDSAQNMARYYSLSLQPTLFGEMALVRTWGRIGTMGQQKSSMFLDSDEAAAALEKLTQQKLRKGYR